MNKNMHKLMKVSGFFRGLVFIATAVVLIYLGYSYLVHDEIRFSQDVLFDQLWQEPMANRSILLAIYSPSLIVMLTGIYWLQRLLSHYQQGQFFGQAPVHCYLWLIWFKVIEFVIGIAQYLAVGYYHGSLFEQTTIELPIDFGHITTILLMLLIVYLLKAAREIEQENKEFI